MNIQHLPAELKSREKDLIEIFLEEHHRGLVYDDGYISALVGCCDACQDGVTLAKLEHDEPCPGCGGHFAIKKEENCLAVVYCLTCNFSGTLKKEK